LFRLAFDNLLNKVSVGDGSAV